MKYRFQFILVVAMMLLAIATHAQTNSTFQTPYVGATHTYSVDGGATGNTNTFTWYVIDKNGTKLNSGTNNVFTFGGTTTSSDGQNIIGAGVTSLPVTWNSTAAGNTYYLCVEEKGGGCTNKRIIEVKPVVSAFDIFVADATNINDLSSITLTNALVSGESCPELPTPINGQIDQSNNGTTVLQYKIWMTGSLNDWSFDFKVTQTGNAHCDYQLTDSKNNSLIGNTALNSGSTISVPTVLKENSYCVLKLIITNKPTELQMFKVDILAGKDNLYSTPISTTSPKSATHTIDAMPNTTSISGN